MAFKLGTIARDASVGREPKHLPLNVTCRPDPGGGVIAVAVFTVRAPAGKVRYDQFYGTM